MSFIFGVLNFIKASGSSFKLHGLIAMQYVENRFWDSNSIYKCCDIRQIE